MRAVIVAMALLASACGGGRCKDVESARQGLVRQGAANRGADVRVTVPYEQANEVMVGLLKQEPLRVDLDPPNLGPIEIGTALTATVQRVRMVPTDVPLRARLALEVSVEDGEHLIGTLAATVEVEPVLSRGEGSAELTIGLGPQNLIGATPKLVDVPGSDLVNGAIRRWAPKRLPDLLASGAAKKLREYLTSAVWKAIREKLGGRIGDVTRIRLRLPDVPVARTELRSNAKSLVVEIWTDLPVRRGLAAGVDDEVAVRISGSAAAELANWAIDQGHAPRWYNRNIEPRDTGQFRPRFDYVAEDRAHPIKVFSFQERGGCSYFRIGARARVSADGKRIEGTVLDQDLEGGAANPLLEVGAWTKYFVIGWVDRSKHVAATTRLVVGTRTLATAVTSAALIDDELRFALRFDASGNQGTAPGGGSTGDGQRSGSSPFQ